MQFLALFIFCASLAAAAPPGAPDLGRYPEQRLLIREAETAISQVLDGPVRHDLIFYVTDLYSRAGAFDDVARLTGNTTPPSLALVQAHLKYGDLAFAEAALASITDPETLASENRRIGDHLWRTGRPAEARLRFEAAKSVAARIGDPRRRTQSIRLTDQALEFVDSPPPGALLSSTPHPHARPPLPGSTHPVFPITTGGFRDRDLAAIGSQAQSDADFLTRLYGFMAASDWVGISCITQGADSPFRKTLGLASIEHLDIQMRDPADAEDFARAIPEDDSDCRLAKAEALSAAAASWLTFDKTARAIADFQTAAQLVDSVHDLPYGAVTVTLTIASAQSKGGLVYGATQSFARARELARALPLPPPPPNPALARPRIVKLGPPTHYRGESYRNILIAAIQAHDLGAARDVAQTWQQTAPGHGDAITKAWLDADRSDDALTFARQLSHPEERAAALLAIARDQLNLAGAP